MGDKPRTCDEYVALADSRSMYFQQHTPPRSPSSFDVGANEIEEAKLSHPLLYTPEPSQYRPQRSSFSSASESSRRRFSNSKRRKIQLLAIYVGLALSTGLLLGAVVGSKKGGELVGKYKDLAMGQLTQALGGDKGTGGGLDAENGYDDVEQYLKSGNATDGFRANVFEGYCNLLYLALITQRIPIVPPLVPSPSHLGFDKPLPMINFGEVFDLPRLRRAVRSPILEWKDVKRAHYGEPGAIKTPPVEGLETFLKLGVAYTPVPLSVALPRFPDQSTFWGLAYLTFEEGRRAAFTHDKEVVPGPTLHSKQNIAPDENLGCFDDLYFVSAVDGFEWERDVSPGWRFVGVHVRWNKWVEEVAIEMLKTALGVPKSGEVPPVQDALAEKFGPVTKLGNGHDVIVTSDEKNATWWGEVRRMGWVYVDHGEERIAELYGTWYPAIIDAVVQSMSIGFVGT
ncbi:hypothetical protein FRC00_009151 [Tulasnella sp. 408]|nr:hypothetical protein FRC00_009151 [Tulasnella sp. 408]